MIKMEITITVPKNYEILHCYLTENGLKKAIENDLTLLAHKQLRKLKGCD